MRKAFTIGRKEGLRYVYIGNVMGEGDFTLCPKCLRPLIQRRGFCVEDNRVQDGRCPYCKAPIAGVF
jgi:pyruvate formate lyase activating enzyme